jgi:SAM-dependent methyltransferase
MEANLRHGDNFRGVGWTKSQANTDRRYEVMLQLVPPGDRCTLLDVGCGAAHFLGFIQARGETRIAYTGLDMSQAYLALCRSKYPEVTFLEADLLDPQAQVPAHDYVVMNGIFNYKGSFGFDEMWDYCRAMLMRASQLARRGFAFNVVSKHVDWERDDLFHVPIGLLTDFVGKNCSRSFVLRHDYGLYEYTMYVFNDSPSLPAEPARGRSDRS